MHFANLKPNQNDFREVHSFTASTADRTFFLRFFSIAIKLSERAIPHQLCIVDRTRSLSCLIKALWWRIVLPAGSSVAGQHLCSKIKASTFALKARRRNDLYSCFGVVVMPLRAIYLILAVELGSQPIPSFLLFQHEWSFLLTALFLPAGRPAPVTKAQWIPA